MIDVPHTAMILAAGFGRRMLPLTQEKPKPLIKISGRPLIDWVLQPLIDLGVERFIVNVHYFASQVEAYLATRSDLEIIISDERGEVLDTGGALIKARSDLGDNPIFVANTDAFWFPTDDGPLRELVSFFDEDNMDVALLLADQKRALGYRGGGDFKLEEKRGTIVFDKDNPSSLVYSGYRIEHPRIYDTESVRKISVLDKWRTLMKSNRVFGIHLDRFWLHVGDPIALQDAQVWLSFYGR